MGKRNLSDDFSTKNSSDLSTSPLKKKKKKDVFILNNENDTVPIHDSDVFSTKIEKSQSSEKKHKKHSKKHEKQHKTSSETAQTPSQLSKQSSESISQTMQSNKVNEFPILPKLIERLQKRGIETLFPIQVATFTMIMAGNDVIGRAKTGTGKTLAFTLPTVQKLLTQTNQTDQKHQQKHQHGRKPQVLVLTPTRELAKQIQGEFEALATHDELHCITVYGGTAYDAQEAALRRGVDVVIGTCGRLKDLMEKGTLKLEHVHTIILDETDEMLNQGFADDVEILLRTIPKTEQRQTLLFSATIPEWVQKVADKYLKSDHKKVDLVGNTQHSVNMDVTHYALACHWQERNNVLKSVIDVYGGQRCKTIVFAETKKDANEVAMASSISSECEVLHGDISQAQREATMKSFRDNKFSVLVATDVAARGIDISGVELVIQLEPPKDVESYIHRSGRTGRAGKKGIAIVFFTPKQLWFINNIERQARIKFQRVGVPQANDIIVSASAEAVSSVKKVNPEVLPYFTAAAKTLLAEHGVERDDAAPLVAACLAQIAGHAQPPEKRSLLTSATGFVTVHMKTNAQVRSLSFVWSQIKRYLFEDADEKVKGMRLTADQRGAVFDIPVTDEHIVRDYGSNSNSNSNSTILFEIAAALPELQHLEVTRPPSNGFRGRSSSYGGGGGNRFSRGGRGGGGGGGYGGGGGRGGRGGRRY